jgi:hypothetical protein
MVEQADIRGKDQQKKRMLLSPEEIPQGALSLLYPERIKKDG